MARKKSKQAKKAARKQLALPDHTKQGIGVVVLIIVGLFLTLAGFNIAGPKGSDVYRLFYYLVGYGYFLLPTLFFLLAANAMRKESTGITPLKTIVGVLFVASGLGFISAIVDKDGAIDKGGIIGHGIATPLVGFFDIYVSLIILGGLSLITLLVLIEGSISAAPFAVAGRTMLLPFRKLLSRNGEDEEKEPIVTGANIDDEDDQDDEEQEMRTPEPMRAKPAMAAAAPKVDTKEVNAARLAMLLGEYKAPPLSILERDKGRPGVGDIKGNANIIKRTLANFGIVVELDEISIGPSVTRYAIKPAEGVRLQKIVGLQTNLELALAAHPVRIEAPIPGKSLVGIEVPNTSKVTVGLGTLLEAPEFKDSPKPLLVALGRDIAGNSVFANLAKMPHGLIAGATGSGKSVTIHAIINSLLFRLGPSQLRFLMIDPKRVELTLYNKIPHLLTPVITDAKKAIMALRWAGKEMDRRYTLLEENRVRDIDSYHQNVLAPKLEELRKGGTLKEGEKVPEAMPYIVVIIDELADIMQTYPRELEAVVVRLAQMSRAVGIHLLLSTQRPSVNVITGLIKANVPGRVALQVASQIDSRTILDQGGAEKLLGAGDMLYLTGDMGKPVRLQSAFIGETEVKKVVDYIADHNDVEVPIDMGTPAPGMSGSGSGPTGSFDGSLEEEDGDDAELYEAARQAVIEAGKGSTSYIQRKLRVGYSRAARLMDLLEERGVIGPADGAKPREVLDKGGYGNPEDGQAPQEGHRLE
jgi:S-DNA-T family DNA segregation ATPase FtsK/SpoIIIE